MTWLAIGYAFWLGLLTAISPCPLATNIKPVWETVTKEIPYTV